MAFGSSGDGGKNPEGGPNRRAGFPIVHPLKHDQPTGFFSAKVSRVLSDLYCIEQLAERILKTI